MNNQPVAVAGGTAPAGQPSFRTVLSAGDHNTLALAFFFATLDQDPNLANKIVVIDDPVSSLDEHRTLTTVQEIRNLVGRSVQIIILSLTASRFFATFGATWHRHCAVRFSLCATAKLRASSLGMSRVTR